MSGCLCLRSCAEPVIAAEKLPALLSFGIVVRAMAIINPTLKSDMTYTLRDNTCMMLNKLTTCNHPSCSAPNPCAAYQLTNVLIACGRRNRRRRRGRRTNSQKKTTCRLFLARSRSKRDDGQQTVILTGAPELVSCVAPCCLETIRGPTACRTEWNLQ